MSKVTISTFVIVMGSVCLALSLLTAMTATATGVNMIVQFVSAQGDANEENGGENTPSGTDEVTPTPPVEEPGDEGNGEGEDTSLGTSDVGTPTGEVGPSVAPTNTTSDQEVESVVGDILNGDEGGTENIACAKETGAAKGLCGCDTKADCIAMAELCVAGTIHGKADDLKWCEWKSG